MPASIPRAYDKIDPVGVGAYLEQQWTREGKSRAAWCREHGIQQTLVKHWQDGDHVPTLSKLVEVANSADLPLARLLVAAGVIPEGEVTISEAGVVTPEEAIRLDATLSEATRAFLIESIERVRTGTPGTVRKAARKRTTRS